jgi:hypothetical protein
MLNPSPCILDPRPCIPNPTLQTLNPKSPEDIMGKNVVVLANLKVRSMGTETSKPQTLNPKSKTRT